MIIFLHTKEHAYTHQCLVGADPELNVRLLGYSALPHVRSFPHATYVFTDLDRLPTEALRLAARLFRELQARGFRALNDPAKVLSRSGLLRALYTRGLNSFNAYRVEEGLVPKRWPVFLRTEGEHTGPRPTLYGNQQQLEAGIIAEVAAGLPKSKLLIVEYMAQPIRPGLFRKLSGFRIGSASVACTNVHDTEWIAKQGQLGITPPELYDDELRIVRDDPFGSALAEVFAIGGIDYGRADFALVDGRIEVYEINTNPKLELDGQHPSSVRLESYRIFRTNYLNALKAIDTPGGAVQRSA
jgi:hypothetical protein